MDKFLRTETETIDEFLWRIGCLKEKGVCSLTWTELAPILNTCSPESEQNYSESYWRKRFKAMTVDRELYEEPEEESSEGEAEEPDISCESQGNLFDNLQNFILKIEKQRVRVRDERQSYSRCLRHDARQDSILDMFAEKIEKVTPFEPCPVQDPSETAIYAMQSDIHFGMTFDNYIGKYDSVIASDRVMRYAAEIIRIGRQNNSTTCYVSLMGDLVSGSIHQTIRVENKENAIEQVIGVSELVSSFLHQLSSYFSTVFVNSVAGNHSRLDPKGEDSLRGEKLDSLVPWYCKARQSACKNIVFVDNIYDDTIGSFDIYGNHFVCVHGDMDNDLKVSAQRIERLTSKKIDYLLAGHMHVAEMYIGNIGYIRNGSVCGSGDEYTVKKRLFGYPTQVCFTVTDKGVEAIYPVRL